MLKRKITILVFFSLLLAGWARGQVSVVFIPEVQGRTLDGLLGAKISNPGGQRITATLTIKVTAQQAGQVVTIKTSQFEILPGINSLPPGLLSRSAIRFGTNRIAEVIRQSGYFTAAEYDYCFELTDAGVLHAGVVLAEPCFSYMLEPFSPLLLMTPADKDVFCNKRPAFFWQPLLPAVPGVLYRLTLTEVKPGQAAIEALNYNTPVINQMNISVPLLFYPPLARDLEEGKQYAWQVTAYRNNVMLVRSEIWSFDISCKDSSNSRPATGFRDIDDLAKGNFYIAAGSIRFAVRNIYDKAKLRYRITSISRPDQKIKKLPVVNIGRGVNHVIIPLEDNRSFIDGDYYLLEVILPDGEKKLLRFLFKTETE